MLFRSIDRNVSFGWNTGILFQEIRGALYGSGLELPYVSFIGGLGGEDFTLDLVDQALDSIVENSKKGNRIDVSQWLWSPRKGVKK